MTFSSERRAEIRAVCDAYKACGCDVSDPCVEADAAFISLARSVLPEAMDYIDILETALRDASIVFGSVARVECCCGGDFHNPCTTCEATAARVAVRASTEGADGDA